MPKNQGTEPQPAPATVPQSTNWVVPRHKIVERQGQRSEPYTHRHPQVRGGVCEWCGIIDQNVEAADQYKLCPHYRGMQLRCSYCPDGKDPQDVIAHHNLNIADHPDKPDELIVWCDSYDCSRRHEQRFKRSA